MKPIDRTAAKEVEAAQILKQQLADLLADDPELLADTIEGETDLFEIVRALILAIGRDEAAIKGLKTYTDSLKARAERFAHRILTRKALIRSAFEIAEVKKREFDIATVYRQKVPDKAVIVEEADVPAQFWKQPAPVIDKRKLLDALKDGADVPGASLSNGGETIAIRVL